MNYFELFGLPVQLKTDKAVVRKKYLELSRESHPDYFVNEGAEKQQQAVEATAILNKALKTLTSEDEILAYVLTEKGLLDKNEKYALPADFLMEMMEFNEDIADAGDTTSLKNQLETLQNNLYGNVKDIVETYKEGFTTNEELLQVKEYYFKKKYLERLKDQLDQKS